MNINPQSSRRLLVLALVLAFVLPTVGTYNTSAIQQTPDIQAIAEATDEADKTQREINLANARKSDAEGILKDLKRFSNFDQPDRSALNSMEQLAVIVPRMFKAAAETQKLADRLKEAQDKLTEAAKKLDTTKTKLDAATSNDNIEKKKTLVTDTAAAARTLSGDLGQLINNLNDALGSIYDHVATVADAANTRLEQFKQPTGDDEAVLKLFESKLSDVPAMMQFHVNLQKSWDNLSPHMEKVFAGDANKPKNLNTQLAKLKNTVETVAANLNVSIDKLARLTTKREDTLYEKAEEFRRAPVAQEKVALADIKEAQRDAEKLDKIRLITETIAEQAKSQNLEGFDATITENSQKAFTKNVILLRRQTSAFQELLSGDRSLWVTEKIRLYYFTDIPRLIQTLNPNASLTGGDAGARQQAEMQLEDLRTKEDAQSAANANVASFKRQVIRIRQQLQQAQADLNLANIRAAQAARKDTELKRRPEKDVTQAEKEDSAAEKTRTEEDRKAAQKRVDTLNDTQNGLAAQLATAERELELAQAAFEDANRKTIRSAQLESAAFANARDNAPFWFAPSVATSSDPAMRVEITSSTGGENAIFIRGAKEDIVKVQDIVAKLDEPAPQARMTLWKIELNSDATQKGAERFNKALEIVEEEISTTRGNIADALSLFLGAVSEEAEYAASISKLVPTVEKKDCHESALYAKFFANRKNTDISGRYERLKRYELYAPQVRRELGIDFLDELGFDNPKQFGLKDPGSATTLNEALIITLLAQSDHRARIMEHFMERLQKFDQPGSPKTEFTRLAAVLRDPPQHLRPEFQTTRQQQELIYAMRNPLLKHLVGRIARLQARVKDFRNYYDNGKNTNLNATNTNHNGTTSASFTPPLVAFDDDLYKCLQKKLPKIFDTIHDEFLISPMDIMDGTVKLVESGEGTVGLDLPTGLRTYNLSPSPARVAAADGMLDIYTKAFEDDIDRVFVRPMLGRLREKLKKKGIGFGVIQRTSVLATNRLVARVDPRATSELAVGQETNLIQGLQQIAQLTLDAKAGNVAGVFGQFGQLAAEKDAAEIYGITSGSAFQVTPIFDPTGQALRFKFDFVDTTLVREPRGTVNPRLPRVERHTVNTEVQLANLELREVSRFESDAKIGLPTTYKGGLPILKDIPGVRPIPLIGWFIRRKGSNAIAQRSLIFAQTTMSPTIGDILDLFDTSLQRR